MKNKFILLLAILYTLTSFAWGGQGGNGGDGIEIKGQLYLLDLYEAGMEVAPFFDPSVSPDSKIVSSVNNSLASLGEETQKLVAQKMSEISKVSEVTAITLQVAMELYSWRVVTGALVEINDTDGSDIQFPTDSLVQLAVRNEKTIKINRDHWSRLSAGNKAALVFHEIVYALNPTQSSRKAREVVGYLFSPDLNLKGNKGLASIVDGSLPMAFFSGWVREGETMLADPVVKLSVTRIWSVNITPRNFNRPERIELVNEACVRMITFKEYAVVSQNVQSVSTTFDRFQDKNRYLKFYVGDKNFESKTVEGYELNACKRSLNATIDSLTGVFSKFPTITNY